MEAERRLKEANESLSRLEKAVVKQQNNQGETVTKEEQQTVQEEMITDVKTLKRMKHILSWDKSISSSSCTTSIPAPSLNVTFTK